MDKTEKEWLEILDNSFAEVRSHHYPEDAPDWYEYLSSYIFGFDTDDAWIDKIFVIKALEVCSAINNRRVFNYIESNTNNYVWYVLMCNMPFFSKTLEFGCSIRSSFWHSPTFQSLGLWFGEEQYIEPISFKEDEWKSFINALIEFAIKESQKEILFRKFDKEGQVDDSKRFCW